MHIEKYLYCMYDLDYGYHIESTVTSNFYLFSYYFGSRFAHSCEMLITVLFENMYLPYMPRIINILLQYEPGNGQFHSKPYS